ncbi:MAG: hypothetical protein OEY49_19635, partial [Candidatus Heimdallarchaeota archaeon]|nr:hypothetical protein [Candidatus Heimdallarchaeota archaeon]
MNKFFLFFLVILLVNIVGAADNVDVIPTVDYANYGDFDGDGFEDDVYINVTIDLTGANMYNFDYTLILTLPSGLTYIYDFIYVTETNLVVEHYLMDHATEPGWYTVDVDITMKTGGINHAHAEYIFDPPG